MTRFIIGDRYTCSALYGGELQIVITGRTDTTVTFNYTDDISNEAFTQDIIVKDDYERIEAWEHHGNKCYWSAKSHDGYNDDADLDIGDFWGRNS